MRLLFSIYRNRRQKTTQSGGALLVTWSALIVFVGALSAEEPSRFLPLPIQVCPVQPASEMTESLQSAQSAFSLEVLNEPLNESAPPSSRVATVAHNAPYVTPPTGTPGVPSVYQSEASSPLSMNASDSNGSDGSNDWKRSMRIGSYRQARREGQGSSYSPDSRTGSRTGLSKVVASLAVVLGVLFGFVWVSRRFGTTRSHKLPDEVIQVLGQFPLGGRQQACVVRFGSKLLALSVTPTGVESLGELDDLAEVEGLTQLCLATNPKTVPARLRKAVDRYAASREA